MKTLIVYYSFSGRTKALCESIKTDECDLYEIKETKKRGALSAYTIGCSKAIRNKPSNIQPINTNVNNYETVIVASPIWAGTFAPAVIAFLNNADLKNKKVIAIGNSASGGFNKDKVNALIKGAGADCVNIYSAVNGQNIEITELK